MNSSDREVRPKTIVTQVLTWELLRFFFQFLSSSWWRWFFVCVDVCVSLSHKEDKMCSMFLHLNLISIQLNSSTQSKIKGESSCAWGIIRGLAIEQLLAQSDSARRKWASMMSPSLDDTTSVSGEEDPLSLSERSWFSLFLLLLLLIQANTVSHYPYQMISLPDIQVSVQMLSSLRSWQPGIHYNITPLARKICLSDKEDEKMSRCWFNLTFEFRGSDSESSLLSCPLIHSSLFSGTEFFSSSWSQRWST